MVLQWVWYKKDEKTLLHFILYSYKGIANTVSGSSPVLTISLTYGHAASQVHEIPNVTQ